MTANQQISYVPREEFKRILALDISREEKTELFATLCRLNVLYMIARAGSGHIGTSFSSVDVVSWLFLNELDLKNAQGNDKDNDIYFSSKGHDVPAKYSVLLALGLLEFEKIHTLRRLNGLPGHPDVSIPFMHSNTGSLGMGISKARGMALSRRLEGRPGNFFVLTGDGELQEGQFWESLQPTVNRKVGEITVIVDHNKVQSDTYVSRVSDLGDLEKKFAAFGWHVARCDGHDFKAIGKALESFKSIKDKPKILIADTVKGKGVSFMEHTAMTPGPGPMNDRLYKFHSGAPSDEHYAAGVSELLAKANGILKAKGAAELQMKSEPHPGRKNMDGFERLIPAYSRALVKAGEQNPKLVVLDADLALDTGVIPFEEKFPNRFFECGIAEQDMVSQAGGMALSGLLPVVHSFACFLSDRPNEQIFNNATERTKVIYAGSLAGLLPSGPGHSHQCVRDISALAGIPGMALVEPSCEQEVEQIVDWCVNKTKQSSYIRLITIPVSVPFSLPENYKLTEGCGVALTQGDDAVIFSYGPVMLSQAYLAAEKLTKSGIGVKVINMPWLNRVDDQWLKETVSNARYVFTLDNHYVVGGQGEFLLSRLAQMELPKLKQCFQLGVTEIPKCGQNDEVLKAHGLDADSLVEFISSKVQSKEKVAGRG